MGRHGKTRDEINNQDPKAALDHSKEVTIVHGKLG
jgi:hypothetical protein